MRIDTKYDIGEAVYLKTDGEQKQRIIVKLTVSNPNSIEYLLNSGIDTTWHYDFEFNKEKDVLKSIE